MTTLVAIQGKGFAVMAAESQLSADGFKTHSAVSKMRHSGQTIIACAGNLRGINLLHHAWTAPAYGRFKSTDSYMTRAFIPSMRKMFIANGYDMKDLNEVATSASSIIVAIKSVLYTVESDYAWERTKSGIYAVGSGTEVASGVMWSNGAHLNPSVDDARKICLKAIEGAKFFDSASGYDIVTEVQYV